MLTKRRRSLLGVAVLAVSLTALSVLLLLKSEIYRWEARFSEYVQDVTSVVHNQLDTNDAVLAGFSAFLVAVDQGDVNAASRYAEAVLSAYPHIYMIEVARGIPTREQKTFEAQLRHTWRSDFLFKDFRELTQLPLQPLPALSSTWPVLFMYPEKPETRAIYGVKLETVSYLSQALARTQKKLTPNVSSVFSMYEGENAYILMQSVTRPKQALERSQPSFFGHAMIALLLIKTDSMLEAVRQANPDHLVEISATLNSSIDSNSHVFSTHPPQGNSLENLLLPRLSETVKISSTSQPMTLQFKRQLHLSDLLTKDVLIMLALLAGVIATTSVIMVQHFRVIEIAEREHERCAHLATHDVATQLPNRHLLADRFDQALSRWNRYGAPFALMVIDLDHFKIINDTYGHSIGDQVLLAVAERMRQAVRACDTVARYGGDEFVILITDSSYTDTVDIMANKILETFRHSVETTAGELFVSCSLGVSHCPMHGQCLEALLKVADQAMYNVKQIGRNVPS